MYYRELLTQLQNMSEEQLNQTVTIHLKEEDEFFGVRSSQVTTEDDVLDKNHFYLEVFQND